MIHILPWINLEITMLSKRSQTQKVTYHMIPFLGNVQNRQDLGGRVGEK
jgi:hypothetical protein